MLIDEILRRIPAGSVIPKPSAKAPFLLLGDGKRRGERAVIYSIPNHGRPERPYRKGLTQSELEIARLELERSGELTRKWFNEHLESAAREGGCNFTTLGGLLQLLGRAQYAERARYTRTA